MAQINVFSVNLVEFNLRIIAGYEDVANPGVVSEAIALTIKNYLRPGNLELGRMIFNKAIERRVMNVSVEPLHDLKVRGFRHPPWLFALIGYLARA